MKNFLLAAFCTLKLGCVSPPIFSCGFGKEGQADVVHLDLDYYEQMKYLNYLKQGNKIDDLRFLAHCEIKQKSLAANYAVVLLAPREAVSFCKEFNVNSPCWESAFEGLRFHSREDISDYVREVFHKYNANPRTRYNCYRLCMMAGWPDLVEYAKSDVTDNTLVPMFNQHYDEVSLGHVARKYLHVISKTVN